MSNLVTMARLMQGNEAVAEAALAAGVSFFAGYPITPSTDIAEYMAKNLPRLGGRFIQMEDEIASLAAVIGASLAGLKSITATSGPGFSLMQENLGFAVMAEVPLVLVNVMRCGPSTGMPTAPGQGDVMQARWGSHGDRPIIALCPSTVGEAYRLTIRAVNLSEKYMVPVILLMDEVVGHLRERVLLPGAEELEIINRKRPQGGPEGYLPYQAGQGGVPVLAPFGSGYRYHITGLVHNERGLPANDHQVAERLVRRLSDKIYDNVEDIVTVDSYRTEDAEILVVAYGATARSALKAVKLAREKNIPAGLWRPVTIWPFPEGELYELSRRAKGIVVAEMNMGQIKGEVERQARGGCPVAACGRVGGEMPAPGDILAAMEGMYSHAK